MSGGRRFVSKISNRFFTGRRFFAARRTHPWQCIAPMPPRKRGIGGKGTLIRQFSVPMPRWHRWRDDTNDKKFVASVARCHRCHRGNGTENCLIRVPSPPMPRFRGGIGPMTSPPGWSSFWFRGSRRAIGRFAGKNATPAVHRGEGTLSPSLPPGSKKQPQPGFQLKVVVAMLIKGVATLIKGRSKAD